MPEMSLEDELNAMDIPGRDYQHDARLRGSGQTETWVCNKSRGGLLKTQIAGPLPPSFCLIGFR